jgi:hypothetical protein
VALFTRTVLVKLRTLVSPAYRKDTGRIPEGQQVSFEGALGTNYQKRLHTGRIPEGYRKDTGRESKKSPPMYGVYFMKSYVYI